MPTITHPISRAGCLLLLTWFVSVHPSSGRRLASSCGSICDYDEGTRKADCSNRSLNLVPQQCFSAVSLNLQGNEIDILTSGIFANFSSLKMVDISKSNMREIQTGTFSGLNSLKKLFLSGNNLTNIVDGMFEGLRNLRILNLANNLISSIGEGKFQEAGSLNKLYLADNSIHSLEADALLGLKSLNTLSLSRNLIVDIHEGTFGNTPNLENLYLGMNKITTLPKNVFQNLHSLKQLSLAANQISTVPPSVLRLESLKRLDLQSNLLQDVSPLVPKLHQLTDLHLNGNPLLCSGCPEPLLEWFTMKYEDTTMECSMPDGTIVKVSSLVASDPEVVFVPIVSTPYQPHTAVNGKTDCSDDKPMQDSDGDVIRTVLFTVVPLLFMILIGSIILLEFQARQRIARKENPRIFSPDGTSKYRQHEYRDSDDDENIQGLSNSGAFNSVPTVREPKRMESSC